MTSRSFMDAIRSVGRKSATITEGAKDKTSDGMTKDAKHFAQDLHKVQDPGMKHLVQKDSETKDYETMFKGGVDKTPTRLADVEPSQGVDKYVEYNEAVQMEAKKMKKKDDDRQGDNPDNEDATGPLTNEEKKCGKDCNCKDCKTVSESQADAIKRVMAQHGRNASGIPVTASQSIAKPATPVAAKPAASAPTAPLTSADRMKAAIKDGNSGVKVGTTAKSMTAQRNTNLATAKTSRSSEDQPGIGSQIKQNIGMQSTASQVKPSGMSGNYGNKVNTSTMASVTKSNNDKLIASKKVASAAAAPGSAQAATPASSIVPKPTPKPASQNMNKPAPAKAKPTAAKPVAAKPQAAKPAAPVKPQRARLQTKTQRDDIAGPSNLRQSYEIEWNGNSYVMNEAQIQALDAFIAKYGIMEGTAGEFIKKEMEHPEKLTAKSKKQKIKQSLAIYYSKKRRGENP